MQDTGARTKAREFAFKFIYQYQLPELKNSPSENRSDLLDKKLEDFSSSYSEEDIEHPNNILTPESLKFAKNLISTTLSNWSPLEEKVMEKTKGWKIENMDKIDLSILMICACELKHVESTPPSVVINEGVKLAKKFGAGSSFSFINGILDALAKG
jgi:N utilization substance protein B